MPFDLLEPFGPMYPDLGSGVAKYRRMAVGTGGLMAMDRQFRQAYGEAVEKAIRAKQRSELQRELPTHAVHCASGTNHSDGADIHEAIRRRQRAALLACPSQYRRDRPDHVWREMFVEAMAEKAARNAPPPEPKQKRAPRKRKPPVLPVFPVKMPAAVLRVVTVDGMRVAS